MCEDRRHKAIEGTDDLAADTALQQGLRTLPVPAASPDFDARVLAALRNPVSWWQAVWLSLRPVLSAAVCSLTVTLILIHWASQMPPGRLPASSSVRVITVDDRTLDRTDLSAASLVRLSTRPITKTKG